MSIRFEQLVYLWGPPKGRTIDKDRLRIGNVSTDSRKIKAGDFFIPISGKYFDGHDFLLEAYKAGSSMTVISNSANCNPPSGFTYWIVDNTLMALHQLATLKRQNLEAKIIAITGSVGKTTTKDILKTTLSSSYKVLATSKNFNNEIGLPLTILEAKSFHNILILEMGMRAIGEIKTLSSIAHPDIAIITMIGNSHIGRLGSLENIAKAKCEITYRLRSDGVVIIPSGDVILEKELSKVWNGRVLRISMRALTHDKPSYNNLPQANYCGQYNSHNQTLILEGQSFQLPYPGEHIAYNFLFAIAIQKELNLPIEIIKKLKANSLPGRNLVLYISGITLLDETYNSSPESLIASLVMLNNYKGKHFAIIGTMKELGRKREELHLAVAQRILELDIEGVLYMPFADEVTSFSKILKENLSKFQIVTTYEDCASVAKSWLEPGDTLLIKGSRSSTLEKIIPLLKAKFN